MERQKIVDALDLCTAECLSLACRFALRVCAESLTMIAGKYENQMNKRYRFGIHQGCWRGSSFPPWCTLQLEKHAECGILNQAMHW